MASEAQKLADRLEREGEKVVAFLQEIAPEQYQTRIYSDGAAWTLHSLVAHFVEAEGSIPRLVARILERGEGVPADFDLNRYNERKTAQLVEKLPEELIQDFIKLREETVKMVRGMREADLAVVGRHPFLGMAEVGEMLKLMYIHLQVHLRDIRQVLKAA